MPVSDFSVAFHIGAHKTATSHLQRSLRDASDDLADLGVQYYGPAHFRLPGRSLQQLFGLTNRAARNARRTPVEQLELLRKGGHRVVMSEENYIGVLNSPRRREVKMRYPHAAKRMNALSEALGHKLDVFLCVRNPADFLNSAYGQLLLGGRFMPVERYFQINPLQSVNWLSMVKRMKRAKGVGRLTIWRYEDYEPIFPRICAAMVGKDAASVVAPLPRRIHIGLSEGAVAEVRENHGTLPLEKLANRARKHQPVSVENPKFDGFTGVDHALAAEIYAQQTAAIRAIPGITFLQP